MKKALLASVGEKLSLYGFNKKAVMQSFYRGIEEGWVCAHLSFIDHYDDFDVKIDVAIRFNKVEDLVNEHSNYLTKKEKDNTSTLGVDLGNLSGNRPQRWTINAEEQIGSVAESIFDVFSMYGEPYLKKYSTIDKAYSLLSSDEESVWMHSPFHANRAKKAIAIAKIFGHPDIESQISKRKQFLESKNDFGILDFVNFTNSLLQKSS